MRNFDKAEKEAMKVLDDRDGLTVGEMQALHEMGDWNKISKSFFLGAVPKQREQPQESRNCSGSFGDFQKIS